MARSDKATGKYATHMELVEAVHGARGTRQEIAEANGTSVGTVSRILNPSPKAPEHLKLNDYWRIPEPIAPDYTGRIDRAGRIMTDDEGNDIDIEDRVRPDEC